MNTSHSPRKYVITFLAITFLASSVFWYLILRGIRVQELGGLYIFGLMWCPGLAGIVTTLIYQRNLRGLGFGRSKPRYMLLLGYGLPLLYSSLVYGVVWLTGLGVFSADGLASSSPLGSVIAQLATLGVLMSLGSAMGEELGWRGLLAPQLARLTGSFTKTAFISGVIHAAWHLPLILFASYRSSAPLWYGVLCFSIMAIGLNFLMVWLRLKSGSFWPAALLHASHNAFVQSIFDPLTEALPITPYITGEFGIGLALAVAGLAYVAWRLREMPEPEPAGARILLDS